MQRSEYEQFAKQANRIFLKGVEAVTPAKLIPGSLHLQGSHLRAGDKTYDLDNFKNIWVIGAGKASAAMGHYTEAILGDRITGGFIVTRYGSYCNLRRITVAEAGHPDPDTNSFLASEKIRHIAEAAQESDLVICLWSGGGSALMADSHEPVTADEYITANHLLVRCGATIREINTVRKHISATKGGQLAQLIWPATTINILISDVPGNETGVIASGPTLPDDSDFNEALSVIRKYDLWNEMPESVINHLNEGIAGRRPETPVKTDIIFTKQNTIVAGTNLVALSACAAEALAEGFETRIIASELRGTTEETADFILHHIIEYRNSDELKPFCLLFGGETTVRVKGKGKGGRNQHLALALALKISDMPGITILSAGTDGSDGETDAAGAIVNSLTMIEALERGTDAGDHLSDFDSWTFFKRAGGHVVTGATFTNVMDLVVVIIWKPSL